MADPIVISSIKSTSCEIPNVRPNRTVHVRVRGISSMGLVSDDSNSATATLTTTLLLPPLPSDVGTIAAVGFENSVHFSWPIVTSVGFRFYAVVTAIEWTALRNVNYGDIVVSTSGGDCETWQCTTVGGGVTGSAEPIWPTFAPAAFIADGTVTWTYVDPTTIEKIIADPFIQRDLSIAEQHCHAISPLSVRCWIYSVDALSQRSSVISTAHAACLNGKTSVFVQNTAPEAAAIGDIWIDSGSNNQEYTWQETIPSTPAWTPTLPAALQIPSGSNLFLTAEKIGFYDAGTWKSYLDNLGNLVLGNATDANGLSWQQSTGTFAIRGQNSSGDTIFELKSGDDSPFLANYADTRSIELELMKMNFNAISWAQFAIFDTFNDDSKRASPDTSVYDAVLYKSSITNGGDNTPSRSFGFLSKTYEAITTIYSGTSTGVGAGYLDDTTKSWFSDECKNAYLQDLVYSLFTITGNTATRISVSGTPHAGNYLIRTANPAYAVAFISYFDSSNGGFGWTKFELSFDGGTHWQTFLDTEAGLDYLQGTVDIAYPSYDYKARITLKNDTNGKGSIVYKFLACTDPSPWRF